MDKIIGGELALPPAVLLMPGAVMLVDLITKHPQLPRVVRDKLSAKANDLFDCMGREFDKLDAMGAL